MNKSWHYARFLHFTLFLVFITHPALAELDLTQEIKIPADDPCYGLPATQRNTGLCPEFTELKGSASALSGTCCQVRPLSIAELKSDIKPVLDSERESHIAKLLSSVTFKNFAPELKDKSDEGISVVEYNLHQNREFLAVKTLFTDCDQFVSQYSKEQNISPNGKLELRRQACRISNASLAIVSELDDRVSRSGFRKSVEDIALSAHLNYAVAPEFIELEHSLVGAAEKAVSNGVISADQVANQTENGILSRYPILSARQVRLEKCHDWFIDEEDQGSLFISREIRRGGRSAVIAEIQFPEPIGKVIAVSLHLENKTGSSCRRRQLAQILTEIKDESKLVIMGGDLNTVGDHNGIFDEWIAAGFNLSGNDGHHTFSVGPLTFRLDHLATRSLANPVCFQPVKGETLDFFKSHVAKVSDHLPIALDVEYRCPLSKTQSL